MAIKKILTRWLLSCGVVAGPLYVMVTLAQAFYREGFDLTQHRFSLLTAGDLGWIHQLNMMLVGTLTILLAVGVRRLLQTGWSGRWGPRLIGLVGAAYLFGGLCSSDPVAGFPLGTTPEVVQTTWQGVAQNASRGVSTLILIAASLVIAWWFSANGNRNWAWIYGTTIPAAFGFLTVVGLSIGGNPVAPAFLATPWIWMTMLALHLHRREKRERTESYLAQPA